VDFLSSRSEAIFVEYGFFDFGAFNDDIANELSLLFDESTEYQDLVPVATHDSSLSVPTHYSLALV